MKKFICFALLVTIQMVAGTTVPPRTVDSIDIQKFMGRWYQTHSSLIPSMIFERNGYCVTADYEELSTSSFSVVNSLNKGDAAGQTKTFEVIASLENSDDPGKWALQQADVKIQAGHYWIIRLGPVNPKNHQYDYAVISVPFGLQIYILARDVKEFREMYQSAVLSDLANHGFNNIINKPMETYQESDCVYAPRAIEAAAEKPVDE